MYSLIAILNKDLDITSAYAPVSVITRVTTSTSVAYKPDELVNDTSYNIYWYNVENEAFGFAPQSIIDLTEYYGGDDEDQIEQIADTSKTTKNRLSWSQKGYVNIFSTYNAPQLDIS